MDTPSGVTREQVERLVEAYGGEVPKKKAPMREMLKAKIGKAIPSDPDILAVDEKTREEREKLKQLSETAVKRARQTGAWERGRKEATEILDDPFG